MEWLDLDVRSGPSIRDAVRRCSPERVYHLAGQASVGQSFQAPEETWEINATGTLRVLETLREEGCEGVRVLMISSAEVYGAVPPDRQPIGEDQPMRPVTPYGASKAAAEMLAVQYASSASMEVVIARSFNHIGPGQDERFVLPSLARQLARIAAGSEEPVLRVGNLDVRRDFLDVRDVVPAYVTLMEHGASGETYNVASGESISLEQLVSRLVELSGTNARVVVDADRVRNVDIPMLVGDPSRLRSLGWSASFRLDDTLQDLLDAARPGGD